MVVRPVSVPKFVLLSALLLALCGGAIFSHASDGPNSKKGHKFLYGFATSRLNIAITAKVNPRTGAFTSFSTGFVPFFANSAPVISNNQFMYFSNSFINGNAHSGSQIFGYSIDPAKGILTSIAGSPFYSFAPPISIQGLATTPDGRFLYGAAAGGTIYAFSLDSATGVPTQLPGSPFPSGGNSQLVVDPSGKYLYATDDDGLGSVLGFTIDSNGALTPMPGSPFSIGVSTIGINGQPYSIVHTGSFVYVSLTATNKIAVFGVNPTTGELTRLHGSFATGNSPSGFALANNFLYVANTADGTVSGYSINSANGALTPIPGSPFGAGGSTIATDPSGKFLYLGTFKGVQGYNIDSATGALTLGSAKLEEQGALWLTVVQLP